MKLKKITTSNGSGRNHTFVLDFAGMAERPAKLTYPYWARRKDIKRAFRETTRTILFGCGHTEFVDPSCTGKVLRARNVIQIGCMIFRGRAYKTLKDWATA